jgi:hypothetical protein
MEEFESTFPAVLDSTIMKDWTRCRFAAYQKYFLGKRSVDGSDHDLVVGGAMASAMEATRKAFYLEGVDEFDALMLGEDVLVEQYGEDQPDSVKSLTKCKAAFKMYFQVYPLDREFGLVPVPDGLEYKFSVGLGIIHPDTGEELQYAGRFDMLAMEKGGDGFFDMGEGGDRHWIVDEKTTKMLFGQNWMYDYDLDWQMIGYKWATGHLPYNIEGVKVRKLVLGKKTLNPTTDFPEITIRFDERMVNDWAENMRSIAREMVDSYVIGKFSKSFGNACNEYRGCDYRSICMHLPQPGWKVVKWSPLD